MIRSPRNAAADRRRRRPATPPAWTPARHHRDRPAVGRRRSAAGHLRVAGEDVPSQALRSGGSEDRRHHIGLDGELARLVGRSDRAWVFRAHANHDVLSSVGASPSHRRECHNKAAAHAFRQAPEPEEAVLHLRTVVEIVGRSGDAGQRNRDLYRLGATPLGMSRPTEARAVFSRILRSRVREPAGRPEGCRAARRPRHNGGATGAFAGPEGVRLPGPPHPHRFRTNSSRPCPWQMPLGATEGMIRPINRQHPGPAPHPSDPQRSPNPLIRQRC